MPGDEDALAAHQALTRARAEVVHDLATSWNIMTMGLAALKAHVTDPTLVAVLEDMMKADARGRAEFEALRRLI